MSRFAGAAAGLTRADAMQSIPFSIEQLQYRQAQAAQEELTACF
jgi:hypothetical protein